MGGQFTMDENCQDVWCLKVDSLEESLGVWTEKWGKIYK